MASSSGTTLQFTAGTAAILENLQDAYPQPTLRLRLQNQGEESSEEIEREAAEALEMLLKELEQVSTSASKGDNNHEVDNTTHCEPLAIFLDFVVVSGRDECMSHLGTQKI